MELYDILEEFGIGSEEATEYIAHVGVGHDANPPGRGSGRYPYGSGNRKHQHDWDLNSRIDKMRASGMKDADIAAALGYYQTDEHGRVKTDKDGNPKGSTTKLKAAKQMASNAVKMDEFDEINYYWNSVNPDTGKNYTPTEIGKILGMNESSVRSKYNTGLKGNATKVTETANSLKEAVKEKGFIDVGAGTELGLGVSQGRLNTAVEMLKQQGYTVETIQIRQVQNPTQATPFKVLAPPGTTRSDIYNNRTNVKLPYDIDGVDSATLLKGMNPPVPVKLDKVEIRYDEQGGTKRDGEVWIKGRKDENGNWVAANPDLSLGNARTAQVRIAVDGGDKYGPKYIKGMAVYVDAKEFPPGKDILVNSNKSIKDGPAKALKDLDSTKQNPFGSTVVQSEYIGKDGKKHQSAINIVGSTENDKHVEGVWGTWSKNLPSQFLGKQSRALVVNQLKIKTKQTEDDLEDIRKLNNPIVKKKMLKDFSDQCDANAVSLKAAPIGGQSVKVLMPITSLKDNEVYCPSLPNGTTVALVRFPHAGPFEIPVAKVNNGNKEGKIFLEDVRDAVGINQHVASKLSGADFDGDTAIVIPMTRKNSKGEFSKMVDIKSEPTLPGLDNFNTNDYSTSNPRFSRMVKKDPKTGKTVPTYHVPTEHEKQVQMGIASNLITDMYAKGCSDPKELADAVRYSMVVIDAKKHELNYRQAYKDYHIEDLQKKYQMKENGKYGGASTLLSRSSSKKTVEARQQNYDINPETGEKIFRSPRQTTTADRRKVKVAAPDGYTWTDIQGKTHKSKYLKDENGKDVYATKDGKVVKKNGKTTYDPGSGDPVYMTVGYKKKTQDSTKMYETNDARTLMSSNPNEIEKAYAAYANHQKALANEARKESVAIIPPKKNKEAAQKYASEVTSLQAKLKEAQSSRPVQRQAQLLATSRYNAWVDEHPEADKDDKKKARTQCMDSARNDTGASRYMVKFTEKEWEACNNGAITPSMFSELLDHADKDNYMQLAMPKQNRISDSKKARIKALYNAGYSYEEIANSVGGVSTGSVANIIAE